MLHGGGIISYHGFPSLAPFHDKAGCTASFAQALQGQKTPKWKPQSLPCCSPPLSHSLGNTWSSPLKGHRKGEGILDWSPMTWAPNAGGNGTLVREAARWGEASGNDARASAIIRCKHPLHATGALCGLQPWMQQWRAPGPGILPDPSRLIIGSPWPVSQAALGAWGGHLRWWLLEGAQFPVSPLAWLSLSLLSSCNGSCRGSTAPLLLLHADARCSLSTAVQQHPPTNPASTYPGSIPTPPVRNHCGS